MNKIANIVAYRYSPYPPEFYRFKGLCAPRGIGCGPIAEDAGLWNLAWLSQGSTYDTYEANADPKELGMWSGPGLEYLLNLGDTPVNGEKLKIWAAKMKAAELMQLLADFPPKTSGPYEDVKWAPWVAFAKYRARSSKDAVVDADEFQPVKSYESLVEEANRAELIVRSLAKPGLPIFPKTRRSKPTSIEACLAACIRNASSQGANNNV